MVLISILTSAYDTEPKGHLSPLVHVQCHSPHTWSKTDYWNVVFLIGLHRPSLMDQAVIFLAYIWEVSASNLVQITDYPNSDFDGFL